MALPDFFIAGHQKCGTTALHEMLRQHPQVFMPERKEPSYYVPEIMRKPPTREEYEALFEPATRGQRLGEATPTYLWSHTAAGRIAQDRPDAKIITILREPADFLRSLHLQFLRMGVETEKDFRKAIELDPERAAGQKIPSNSPRPEFLPYAEHLRYIEQLERYRALFSPEQILVLIYEDYRADNDATLRRILDFLGVDQAELSTLRSNTTQSSVRSPRVQELTRSLYMGKGLAGKLKPAVKAVTSPAMRKRLLKAQAHAQRQETQAPDERYMASLRRKYKDDAAALSDYLGRDLIQLWGYSEL
ncbi:MAG TPA: sulfotransferase [Solirubrobacteraceae bacterium]|nr:sulfotransferase [Solirubrobacteraceae bacterium]